MIAHSEGRQAGPDDAAFAIGEVIGPSDWVTVTQPMIDQFGEVTRDPDPMHDDPAWAAQHSPFGGTIAYGFLTLSLLSHLLRSIDRVGAPSVGHFVNYGFDRARLIAPVPVGARVRAQFVVRAIERGRARPRICLDTTVEIEGQARPALVAHWLIVGIGGAG